MKPVGITMGDPAGIGPELIAKLLLDAEFMRCYPFIPIAPEFVLNDAFENIIHTELPNYQLFTNDDIEPFSIQYGKHDARYGDAAMKIIAQAVRLVQAGELSAMVTCPINKHSIAMAGYKYPGHTEYLGYLTDTTDFTMMLASNRVRVIPVTIHIPVSKIASSLKTEDIYIAIRNAHNTGKFFSKPAPLIAVTGLNPHAGDEGTLGNEEKEIISPAIRRAQSEGINVFGPYPADSLFSDVDKYDFFVAMYHDQALIPVKMDGFGSTVNVTLNLPIIRTSVDHGTAFDIAGKGIANISSLQHAVIMAHAMAGNA